MGAIHTRGDSVMSAQMGPRDAQVHAFDAPNRLLMLLAVRNKSGPSLRIDPMIHLRILRATIQRLASPIWDAAARRSMSRHLAALERSPCGRSEKPCIATAQASR
jgi:hypothetical protein